MDSVTHLAPTRQSPAEARRFVELHLAPTPCDTEVAKLLVSELVTNAFQHAHGDMTLRVHHREHMVRVEVTDHDPHLPMTRGSEPLATAGRGLVLVAALASAWGSAPVGAGKQVWFELNCTD